MNTNTLPATILAAKEKFELACKDASALQIVSNFGAAFTAVNVIALLREAMTDEVMVSCRRALPLKVPRTKAVQTCLYCTKVRRFTSKIIQ